MSVLVLALTLAGIGDACLVLADLGSSPWTVLAQGLSHLLGQDLGLVSLGISLLVFFLWLPLGIRPGLGTLVNVLLIASVLGFVVRHSTKPDLLWVRVLLSVVGISLVGIGTALYLTCHQGSGPRDGLVVGICQKTGWSVAKVRIGIEVAVCCLGFLLGGRLGVTTVLFALGVGWVVQLTLDGLRRLR